MNLEPIQKKSQPGTPASGKEAVCEEQENDLSIGPPKMNEIHLNFLTG
jgi:hypothetical protein